MKRFFISIVVLLQPFLLSTAATPLLRMHCVKYGEWNLGFRLGLWQPREAVELEAGVPFIIEIESEKRLEESFYSSGKLTLHLKRDKWERTVELTTSWRIESDQLNDLIFGTLNSYIDVPGTYEVLFASYQDDKTEITLSGGYPCYFRVFNKEVKSSPLDMPNLMKQDLPRLVCQNVEKSGSSGSVTMQVAIERGVLNHGNEEVLAEVSLNYHGENDTARLRPWIGVHLERNGWTRGMNLPLYNLDEIVVPKGEPFVYKFNIGERLDLEHSGEYSVSFSCQYAKTEACKIEVRS